MKIYIRKIDEQCINKQISYTKDILRDFLGNLADHQEIKCEGKTSHHVEKVALLLATDPRFDNSIKHILSAEGDYQNGDLMVIYKTKPNYIVELIKPTDTRYSALMPMFGSGDRHILLDSDDPTAKVNLVCDSNLIKEEYKKWLKTAKKDDGTNYSDKVQSNYIWAVGKASEYLGIELFKIFNYKELLNTIDLFLNNALLMEKDKNEHNNTVSCGLKIYKSFFEWLFGIMPAKEESKGDSPMTTSTRAFPLNFILYGAPGTGKTYSTAEYAVAIVDKLLSKVECSSSKERVDLMNKYRSYVSSGKISFTTFHQSYGYEDFIQGLRPKNVGGVLEFVPHDGVFKAIADKAKSDPDSNYVLIIDEINRANISKVLGELITLLEEDKRIGEINEIGVTLPSGEYFAVPNNLYVIGTMNTADKSISLIDVALRRRFQFISVPVNYSLLSGSPKMILSKLNDKLYERLDNNSDLLIGHAYMIGKTNDDIPDVFNRCIIPLLYEYFFDDTKKVKSLLDDVFEGTDFIAKNDKLSRIKIEKKVTA